MSARITIDYGIDLGTTNSAIAKFNNGKSEIIESKRYDKKTTPSCVSFNRKKIIKVGDDAIELFRKERYNALILMSEAKPNAFIEFKRDMGTEIRYFSTNMDKSYSPEELSSEVLKKLKSYERDENILSAVITIPAMFEQHQKDATARAAKLAGFMQYELLQEPIAASLAYGIDTQKTSGYWLVFDFGGGTYDAALMQVEDGIMKVVETDGDNQLGGKNIDEAIAEKILLPYLKRNYSIDKFLSDKIKFKLLKDVLKIESEEIKIAMQEGQNYKMVSDEPLCKDDEGEEMEFNFEITLEEFEKVVSPTFQKSVDIAKDLLKRKNIKPSELETIILVGGPTKSYLLRKMLKEQLTPNINTSINPMTCVARGAAIYASTIENKTYKPEDTFNNIQLKLEYPKTTVENEVQFGVIIKSNETEKKIPENIFIEIDNLDKTWASSKVNIQGNAEILTIPINSGMSNNFRITLFDENDNILPCEPSEFSILGGIVPPTATLSYAIGIEVFKTIEGEQLVIPITGLEKNQKIPAKGKITLKTQNDIRPGNSDDVLELRIYNLKKSNTKAIYNNWAGTIYIDGNNLSEFLPKDSEVEIKLKVTNSEGIKLSAYFPYTDDEVEGKLKEWKRPKVDTLKLEEEINKAKQSLTMLNENLSIIEEDLFIKLNKELNRLSEQLELNKEDNGIKNEIDENLKKVLCKIDEIQRQSEWPKIQEELSDALERLIKSNTEYGDEKSNELLNQLKQQTETIIIQKDKKTAKDLIEKIRSLDFALISANIGFWIGYIKYYADSFENQPWSDKISARQKINQATEMINNGTATKEILQQMVRAIFELLPSGNSKIGNFPDPPPIPHE